MKEINLTNTNKVALVSDEDYEKVLLHNWYVETNKYVRSVTRFNRVSLHRYILNLPPKTGIIDHIDGNTLNNTRENLRLVTRSQNQYNRRKGNTTTSSKPSKYKGVFWYRSRRVWRSTIRANGKIHLVGQFDNEDDAARAYNIKAKELHGEFACLNIIP